MKNKKTLLAAAISVGFFATASANAAQATIMEVADNDVLLALQASNLDSDVWPWQYGSYASATDGGIKRWDVSAGLIPVQVNGNVEAVQAMDNIEAALGMTLFDRTSLSGVAADDISYGLIVSPGTSFVPPDATLEILQSGMWQGGVSSGPYQSGFPFEFFTSTGAISTRLYINLGNQFVSLPSVTLAEHEFAHALGLSAHFEGFGKDDDTYLGNDAMGWRAWASLSTLYHNPIGARLGEIEVYQALSVSVPAPIPAPVPEPETYAMLLAGLGLLSYTAKRRKQSA